ncbi:MAG: hypothetical protein PHH98_02235 [Candidatus Gracilibacteria bacterium]|nr:hypothetical protein [Candidatus Gracilibacteria bacterium]
MTAKPSVFDGTNVTNKIEKIELLSIEATSQKEYCENPEDIKNSETTIKFLSVIEKRVGKILEISLVNSSISEIYVKFISNTPLTKAEFKAIYSFLSKENVLNEIEFLMSKLLILHGERNDNFINSFLKNEDGNFTALNFVSYIKDKLTNYKLVVDIENGDSIKLLEKTKEGNYYTYKSNGKIGIFIVSNGEIIMLKKLFEKVTLLNNGLIFCLINNKDLNDTGIGFEGFTGLIYDFDGEQFNQMSKIPGTLELRETNIENYFITNNLVGNGLTEISKFDTNEEKLGVEVNELLPKIYNNIRMQGKFIIANKDKSENENIFEIYINTEKGLELVHTTLSDLVIGLRDLGNNYYLVEDNTGKNIYKLDEHNIFNIVDNKLLNMSVVNTQSLMRGEPTVISNNNEAGIYIFDYNTGKLRKLIDVTNTNLKSLEIDGDMLTISTNFGKNIFFYKDGKIYDFIKGYKIYSGYIYGYLKKGLLGEKFFIKNSFEYMSEYLSEIVTPIKLKTK